MTDFALTSNQESLPVPQTFLYQDIASPPPFTEEIAPPFFGAVYPDRLTRLPGVPGWFTQNIEPLPDAPAAVTFFGAVYPDRLARLSGAPGWFTQNVEPLPDAPAAPDFFGAVYPDTLLGLPRVHSYVHAPPPFETLPAPDLGQRAVFPDRLDRQAYLWPTPQAVMNLEPVANPVPDFGNRAIFPDRLVGHPPIPGMFTQNVEPIPNPPAPDFTSVIYPSVLRGFPPLSPPSRFYTPTPSTFLVLEDYSRGLHVGDVRGFYHTPAIAASEPYAIYTTTTNQTIQNSAVTVLTIDPTLSGAHSVFPDGHFDPWGLVRVAQSRLVFKHPGYYLVWVQGQWENNSIGNRVCELRHFTPAGADNGQLARDYSQAYSFSAFGVAARLTAFSAGWSIEVRALQDSGGPLNVDKFFVSIFRFARPRRILPT